MLIGGEAYPLRTDYKAGIAFFTGSLHKTLTVRQVLDLWFPAKQPEDFEAAQEAAYCFYRCGQEEKAGIGPAGNLPYSFEADGGAVLSAFQREYGIDLTKEPLHWWRFQALLGGLISHSFSERVRYRAADLSSIKGKELRDEYSRMKQRYALDPCGRPVERPETLEEYHAWLLQIGKGETYETAHHI